MINRKVRDNYQEYEGLLILPKVIHDKRIIISAEKSNHRDWRKGQGEVGYSSNNSCGEIKIQQKIEKDTIYGSSLVYKTI
ncbi:hypothetical protein HMF3257_00220 [Spirosoma telluris]|uniref:Uncharacterized protein n=1 Tax=Spirosoma telluris TaxID=2183553 RepID=A0A327NDR0_9BACT|nr:hypothetical protein HMF3257_00220 [Spirosoma telluris]